MLPGPGMLVLVLLEGFHRNRQQSGIAVRPQAQVYLVEPAGRGHGRQPGRHAPAEFGVDLGRVLARIVKQENQIQGRGITQFLAAQLAVGDDGEMGQGARHLVHEWPGAADGFGQQQVG
ncbi:hypothetical protein G6F57_021314 [Rhizopus arrhizus]|nr:hypothetical protein G6F57_021314 [Rhizopus arrhizus]